VISAPSRSFTINTGPKSKRDNTPTRAERSRINLNSEVQEEVFCSDRLDFGTTPTLQLGCDTALRSLVRQGVKPDRHQRLCSAAADLAERLRSCEEIAGRRFTRINTDEDKSFICVDLRSAAAEVDYFTARPSAAAQIPDFKFQKLP
jgi:hypothetical protein